MKSCLDYTSEKDHLISGRRNEDLLVGYLQELYFHIRYIGYYVCRKSFQVRRSNMESYILLLTLEGEGKLHYCDKEYRLLPDTVMMIDGRIAHEYYALDDGWTFQYIHYEGAMSRQYYTHIDTKFGSVIQLKHKNCMELSKKLEELFQDTSGDEILDYASVSAKIYGILTSLISYKNTLDASIKSAESVQRAVSYIVENYRRRITTQDIADAAFLSRAYMSEIFTKMYGLPPHEFLTMYRLSHVKEALLNTTTSISEIAEQNGFNDVFTLSRIFKHKFGVSPSKYRKQTLK